MSIIGRKAECTRTGKAVEFTVVGIALEKQGGSGVEHF